MKFGELVVSLRKQWGLKQKELAENLGISATYLSQIENDEQKPSIDLIAKIAKYFDLPVSAFLFKAMDTNKMENKEQQKYVEAAEPIIDELINYLLTGDDKTKGNKPLSKIKPNLPRRKKA